jgi:hypothetical protein
MKTIFENCTITYSEYEYFKSLSNFDKLNYMFGLIETNSIKNDFNLNKFFELIHDITDSKFNSINNQISEKNHNAVDVTIDDTMILIETNHLRALRTVSYRFIESGYILRRELIMEKQYRKRKKMKYMRIFRIINHGSSICSN